VTAEAAVALPTLVLFAMGLIWALLAAAAQIQCVDAARAGARAAARQDPRDATVAAAEQAAPKGARVTVRREGDLVRVRVEADTPGPAALSLHLHQEAVALAEDTVGPGALEEPPAAGTGRVVNGEAAGWRDGATKDATGTTRTTRTTRTTTTTETAPAEVTRS
jgi:Cu/Zn superoxide dismutase